MTAGKAAVPYIAGAGLLIGVGYLLFKNLDELLPSLKEKINEQINESSRNVTDSRDQTFHDFFSSGGNLTYLPEFQEQDRFWTTQPLEQYKNFNEFVDDFGFLSGTGIEIVQTVDNTLGTGLLEDASRAGAEFRIALEQNNDVQRFEELSSPLRALVTVGEALPRTLLSLSPYEAGQDVRNWWDSLW